MVISSFHCLETLLTNACCCFRLADTVVKVPQMAESITEGTLKQFSKREVSALDVSMDWANIGGRDRRLR